MKPGSHRYAHEPGLCQGGTAEGEGFVNMDQIHTGKGPSEKFRISTSEAHLLSGCHMRD